MTLGHLKKIHINVCLAILVFANGCGDKEILAELSPDAVILAFGDSLTHGNGAMPEESYPAILSRLSGRTVVNAGIPGERSESGLKRLPALLAEHQPKLMILCHGGNDILRRNDLGEMEANARAMIDLAKSKDIPVVLLGVPKPGLILSSADVYRKIADSTDVIFMEDLVSDVLADQSLKADTVHPNEAGYRVIAENIHEMLKRSGAL